MCSYTCMMMTEYKCYSLVCFCIILAVSGNRYDPSDLPVCISHGGLCDIAFDITPTITDETEGLESSSPICQCPSGRACPQGNYDKDRTLDLKMNSNGRILNTQLRYCEPIRSSLKQCSFEEVAVTLRGVGPIIMNLVGDVTCTCQGELTLARTKLDGIYTVREYSCGKSECRVNDVDQPVCERSTKDSNGSNPQGDEYVSTEYPCMCPKGFDCSDPRHVAPGAATDVVTELTCAYQTSWWWSWW